MERKLGFESFNDDMFQTQLKAKYKSKIFIGSFKEKRLCESIKGYRDAIIIDSKAEKEISKDLESFLCEINEHTRGEVFVGVSKGEENYTIWTELDEETPFGKYWFQIKTIKFRFNEIQIKLKKLRAIEDDDVKSFSDKLKAATRSDSRPDDKTMEVDDVMKQWKTLYEFWKSEISAAIAWLLSITINRQTILETLRFISLLIVSLFAGSAQIVKYLGIFSIKFIERVTWLARALTPVALGLIDLCSKIIGGFYLLIAMIWRDSTGARRQQPNNAIGAGPQRRPQEAIRYKNYHY